MTAIINIFLLTSCNISNAESDSMDKPVINASSASLISENMSDASDEFAQLKRFANAEEAAESFIKKYYEALYLCSPSDLSAYTAYSAFADYLNEKISYKQEISDYYSNIEGIDVEFELKEKVEYDDKCYFVYFVEVCYEEKGVSDFQSASGSTIQIIIDQQQYDVCDFYIANDSIDRKLRGFEKIDTNKILWENSQASETILLGLNEIILE